MNKKLYIDEIFQEDFELWDINKNIKFDNCIFKWDFNFYGSIIKDIQFIDFKDCTFEKQFIFIDELENFNINFLHFKDCKFLWFTDFEWISVNSLSFSHSSNYNCKFNWNTIFSNIKYKKISFIGLTINNNLSFYDNKTLELEQWQIWFNNIIWKWKIYIDRKSEVNDLIIKNIIEFNSIKIQVNKINKFEFLDIYDLKKFSIWWIEKKENINYMILWRIFNKKEQGFFDFYNLEIGSIEFTQSPQISDNLIFSDLIFKKSNFSNINLWKTIFNWVKIEKLYLENATLNDCIFNWVDFPDNYELEDIEFEQKKIDKITPIKKIWFLWIIKNFFLEIIEIVYPYLDKYFSKEEKIEEKEMKIFETKVDYKKMKDNYRQLKFVMEKNWNKTESNKFFEKEMNSYFKEIIAKNVFITLNDYWNIDNYFLKWGLVWEKITLLFWKILNNFGNNWVITMIWLFLFVSYSTLIKTEYNNIQNIWFINKISNEIDLINQLLYYTTFESFTFIWYIILLIIMKILWNFIEFLFRIMPVIFITLLIIGVFIWTYYIGWEKEIFNDFLKLLFNPFYWFKDLYSEKMEWIELLWFTIYKIIYLIIFWHLIVALKRTTKR